MNQLAVEELQNTVTDVTLLKPVCLVTVSGWTAPQRTGKGCYDQGSGGEVDEQEDDIEQQFRAQQQVANYAAVANMRPTTADWNHT